MSDHLTLGEVIRRARLAQQRTMRWVAERVGVSHGYLADIEHERRSVSPERARLLARALGLDPEWLVGRVLHERVERLRERLAQRAQVQEDRAPAQAVDAARAGVLSRRGEHTP